MPKTVKFVHVALTERREAGKAMPESHIVAVDSRGRIWERFNDMPDGKWALVEAPDDAETKGRKRPRKS